MSEAAAMDLESRERRAASKLHLNLLTAAVVTLAGIAGTCFGVIWDSLGDRLAKVEARDETIDKLGQRVTVVETEAGGTKAQIQDLKADVRRVEDKVDLILREVKK